MDINWNRCTRPLCAALAAQEHGDARRAIDLLRVAGEIAEIESKPKIEEIDVRRALERIEIDRVIEVIKTLYPLKIRW